MLAVFLIAALTLALTPGPDMLYVASRSLGQGRMAGLVSAFGVITGTFVHLCAAALGLSELFRHWPLAYELLRALGAAYLLYLAWRVLRGREDLSTVSGRDAAERRVAKRRVFLQGLMTNLLNPKVGLFYLTFLPQFVDPERGSVALQVLILGGFLNGAGLAVKTTVALSAGGLGDWLGRHPRVQRGQRWLTAGILAALALRVALPEPR